MTANLISVAELADWLPQPAGKPDFIVVDCRFNLMEPEQGRRQWQEGHIPGAFYAHLDEELAGKVTADSGRHPLPDPAAFCSLLGCWGVTPETTVVVYDAAGGAIAARLWWLLRWIGHDKALLLNGGWQAWAAGQPVGTDMAPREPTTYNGRPGQMPVLATAELEGALASGLCLLDARDPARYRGEVEPIDPVAGHVPGAQNHPFSANLGEDGLFLPPADLAAALNAHAGFGSGDTGCMCGSGVTACHTVLAAEEAGFSAPALYVGSWSEWIRDPERQIAAQEG